MSDALKLKLIQLKGLGRSDSEIRRELRLRESTFDYLKKEFSSFRKIKAEMLEKDILRKAKFLDKKRPKPDVLIDQCPIYPRDLVQRVKLLMKNEFPITDKRIMFVGDDDLASCLLITISHLKLIGLIDIDSRILSLLQRTSLEQGKSDQVVAKYGNIANIATGEENDPFGETVFDAFVTDPPYTETGYNHFLTYGIRHLKLGGRAYVAIPYMNLEEWTNELLFKVEKFLIMNGLALEEIAPGFAMYQHDDGVISSMLIAKKVSKPLSIDDGPNFDVNKMYTTRFPVNKIMVDEKRHKD